MTKKTYVIRYRDNDPCCPTFSTAVKGYNKEHALDKFYCDSEDDGWDDVIVVSVKLRKVEK